MDAEGPGLVFTIVSFLLALTVLVFVHEWGHYIVARLFKVRVDVFSIGFGKEILGWTDRRGTRWKISAIPLGGYVKFFGDAGAASNPSSELERLSPEERAVSFHHKPVGARMAIVAAGPVINLVFAALIYAVLFMSLGQPYRPAVVSEVVPDTPAAEAGLQAGDRILSVEGHAVSGTRELVQVVGLYPGQQVNLRLERNGATLAMPVKLERVMQTDRFGNEYARGRLGVLLGAPEEIRRMGPLDALGGAASETVSMLRFMLVATGQVIMGVRSVDDLGGPVRIAKITGEQASLGLIAFIEFIALISINLGLVNLFPIPMLDGGHLLFYGFEAVKGSPVSARVQEFGYIVGFALIISLMVFLTWNDLHAL